MDVSMAERLMSRRKAAGLSQEALADRLGVSRQAVSKWERSEASPDTDNLIALASLYGVTLDELLYGDANERDATVPGPAVPDTPEPNAGATEADKSATEADDPENVHVGWDGIHVSKPGEEVHVGWSGIHVTNERKGEEVHVGPRGIHVHDAKGHTVESDENGGVTVDGTHYESWKAAHDALGHDLSGVSDFQRAWDRFPFWALVVLAYLALGLTLGVWEPGLLLVFAIPLYHVTGIALARKSPLEFVSGAYPVGVVAWFCWMAFVVGQPHPAWAALLTIPLVEALVHALRKR